ncbi:MAG TPA: CARDB domain-containing protein [Longimicrobium sp.]|nr:CARDB domain-containing protein [Longimicrobium sp.]
MKHRIAALALALATAPLLAAALRPPPPDLTPAIVVKGSATTLTIRIRNQGTTASPAGLLNVSLGQPIGWNKNYPMPAIAAGQYASVTVNAGKPLAGVHYTIRLDVNHAIAESNENNNVASGTFP